MELVIRAEPDLDVVETARLGNEAFGGSGAAFTPERLTWLYDRAFSGSTDVLSLFSGETKVGQVALVHQRVRIGATIETAIALIDLFILPAFRSRDAIARLYGEVEHFCRDRKVRFILAVPNGKAAGVNQRFLGMKAFLKLDIRAGLAGPFAGGLRVSSPIGSLAKDEAQALFARYMPGGDNGLAWTAQGFWERLQNPVASYGVHATDSLLLVSARRVLRHVPHTLLCAFLIREGATAAAKDVRAVTAGACRLHRRPFFIYAGRNAALPLPGWSLPERLRPSPMVVQIRDFAEPATGIGFDRFELLDFDFA